MGTTAAVCTESNPDTSRAALFPGATTTTLAQSDIAFQPVTVTAGSVTGVAGPGSGSGSVSPTTTAESSRTTTSDAPSDSISKAASRTSTTSSSSVSSTGGMPRITGNAQIAIGGAVMVLAVAGI
jgi:hypothetical protein